MGWVEARGTDLCGDAGLELLESCSGGGPILCGALAGEFFEEGVHGGAQGAGRRVAFVAGVEPAIPGLRIETWGTQSVWFEQRDGGLGFEASHACIGLIAGRKPAQDGWADGRRHEQQVALGLGGEAFEDLFLWGGGAGFCGLPRFKTRPDFVFECGPGGGKEAICGVGRGRDRRSSQPCKRGGRRGAALRGRVWRRRRGCGASPAFRARDRRDRPRPWTLSRSAPLAWKGAMRNSVISPESSGVGEAALEPGEHSAAAVAGSGLQFGDDDHFEFQAFGFVDGHQLDAASLFTAGSGCAVSLSRAASSVGPRRSCSPPGRRSRQLQSRSRLARAAASTQAAPPRRSQTCWSHVPRDADGWAARRAGTVEGHRARAARLGGLPRRAA